MYDLQNSSNARKAAEVNVLARHNSSTCESMNTSSTQKH